MMAILQEVCFIEDHRAVQQESCRPDALGLPSKKFWSRVAAPLVSTTKATESEASSKKQVAIWVKLNAKKLKEVGT